MNWKGWLRIAKTVFAQSKRADQTRQDIPQGKRFAAKAAFRNTSGAPPHNSPFLPSHSLLPPLLCPFHFKISERETAAGLRCRPCQACPAPAVAVAGVRLHRSLADGIRPLPIDAKSHHGSHTGAPRYAVKRRERRLIRDTRLGECSVGRSGVHFPWRQSVNQSSRLQTPCNVLRTSNRAPPSQSTTFDEESAFDIGKPRYARHGASNILAWTQFGSLRPNDSRPGSRPLPCHTSCCQSPAMPPHRMCLLEVDVVAALKTDGPCLGRDQVTQLQNSCRCRTVRSLAQNLPPT
jgi:hypothetical protein